MITQEEINEYEEALKESEKRLTLLMTTLITEIEKSLVSQGVQQNIIETAFTDAIKSVKDFMKLYDTKERTQ